LCNVLGMFKNVYFRLGVISSFFTLAVLIALPRIPIKIHNEFINIDSYIGGYYLSFFDGRFTYDLRDFKKGLDLEGGIRVVMTANMTDIPEGEEDEALESVREIISRRVNLLGVSEPYIATARVGDDYRVIVELPGVFDVSEAVATIGRTAQLRFKELAEDREWSEDKYQEYFFDPDAWIETGITGADLQGTDVVFPDASDLQQGRGPQIQLRFSPEGREKFSELAKRNVNKPVALYLDDDPYPLSTPIVSPDLAEGIIGDPVISGNFDVQTARELSLQLRAGALPVPVEVLEQRTVEATLGAESVRQSFFAGMVGLSLVLLFLIYAYRRLGILASAALIVYAFIVLAIFKVVPVVLTLPGMAGVVLSVGMATDANILIFERIKEELRWGKPMNLAINLGFERAWNSIRDSNISSLLTAGVLFYFGTGPVRGFALTLSIGIMVSLFTAIVVTKTLIQVFGVGNVLGEKKENKVSGFLQKVYSKRGKKGDRR
jgi:preprotein translocase subunit SecD